MKRSICTRCGRSNHQAFSCYAKTNVHGDILLTPAQVLPQHCAGCGSRKHLLVNCDAGRAPVCKVCGSIKHTTEAHTTASSVLEFPLHCTECGRDGHLYCYCPKFANRFRQFCPWRCMLCGMSSHTTVKDCPYK